jgi:hypothetical protein
LVSSDRNHTVAVLVNGLSFYTLPRTLPSRIAANESSHPKKIAPLESYCEASGSTRPPDVAV